MVLAPRTACETLLSGRSIRLWAVTFLTCLGIASAAAGLIEALFPDPFRPDGLYYLGLTLLGCCLIATISVWPRTSFRRYFAVPGTTITVAVGDLFQQKGHLIIGMNDTFDTDTDTDSVIARSSVQGQLLDREYHGDLAHLDRDLEKALRGVVPLHREKRSERPQGKLVRYPVGTVAVTGRRDRRYFCVAYSSAGNDNYVRSSVDDMWLSLSEVWKAVRRHGERGTVSIPVIGAGLARISNLSSSDLIRLILISYLASSREAVIADHLQVVIHPAQVAKMNLRDIEDFLSVQ